MSGGRAYAGAETLNAFNSLFEMPNGDHVAEWAVAAVETFNSLFEMQF